MELSDFSIEQFVEGDTLHINFNGSLDESSDFFKLDVSQHKNIIFDFDQVTMVNSIGLRNWVLFAKTLPASANMSFEKLRPMVTMQLSILAGFLPEGSQLESFYVPYQCPACQHEEDVLYHRGSDYETPLDHSALSLKKKLLDCPKGCGKLEILSLRG